MFLAAFQRSSLNVPGRHVLISQLYIAFLVYAIISCNHDCADNYPRDPIHRVEKKNKIQHLKNRRKEHRRSLLSRLEEKFKMEKIGGCGEKLLNGRFHEELTHVIDTMKDQILSQTFDCRSDLCRFSCVAKAPAEKKIKELLLGSEELGRCAITVGSEKNKINKDRVTVKLFMNCVKFCKFSLR